MKKLCILKCREMISTVCLVIYPYNLLSHLTNHPLHFHWWKTFKPSCFVQSTHLLGRHTAFLVGCETLPFERSVPPSLELTNVSSLSCFSLCIYILCLVSISFEFPAIKAPSPNQLFIYCRCVSYQWDFQIPCLEKIRAEQENHQTKE